MRQMRGIVRDLLHFILLWIVNGLSLLLTAAIVPGISFTPVEMSQRLVAAFAAALVLSLVNLLIRPLIVMIARPIGYIAVFVIGFLVNAVVLWITAWILPTFELTGLITGIVGGLVFAAINVVFTSILDLNRAGSPYQGRIEKLAKEDPYCAPGETSRGLVMVEIDGLSYHHLKHALETGEMPFLKWLTNQRGYVLSKVDCGIPSQTSACQAGIMFGDNYDIPAYRWYDKEKQKLYVSASDAQEINSRYAEGNGLMREGSSISNMMNGDAAKSLFTLADLKTADEEEQKHRAQDIYLLMLDPSFLMRTIALFLGETVRELWQGWQQVRHDVQPRLNRLHGFYPFVRAGTTVFMRELGANLVILDIVRGAPSIYFTWPGYDEVAHHSGPWTSDAFGVLRKFDASLARIYQAAKERAPRPYDVIILSDHGQSFGPTFLQRYGISLKEFIESLLPENVQVSQIIGGDTGLGPLTAVGTELGNIQGTGAGNAMSRAAAKQGQKLIEKGTAELREKEGGDGSAPVVNVAAPQVVAYGSGNLAQVYFDLLARKITLNELNAAYPGMVDALVSHEGIGMVCGYEDDGTPVCLGKGGRRNLHTGEVTGLDPLKMYAPVDLNAYGHSTIETRVWQTRRVMDFPHAGDLMVVSTVYPDGTVAALEELIGSHGGLGGEQTDAMMFHPGTMAVPETRNSADVFAILDARRGLPLSPEEIRAEAAVVAETANQIDEWSLANLWGGIKEAGTWVPLALRALVLDRIAYREVANNPRMTGPGLLLGLGFSLIPGLILGGAAGQVVISVPSYLVGWLLMTLAVFGVGRVLSRQGYYTRTMRTLGFARVPEVLLLLGLLPNFLGLATFLELLVGFIATWMAVSEAHQIRGWRSVILPVLAILVFALAPWVMILLLEGATEAIQSILAIFGISPQ